MEPVILYYVCARDGDFNYDLIVEAHNPVQATKLWDEHYRIDPEDNVQPSKVVPIPFTGQVGVISWDFIHKA